MKNKLANLKVAIVHDFFVEYGGAERVVEAIHDLFPKAVVYTAVISQKRLNIHWYRFKDWDFRVSWFGKIPFVRNFPSLFRFLTPLIWESFDLSGYDLVISSSGWFMCKGVLTRPETLHLSYIHHQNKFLTYYETPDDWQSNWLKRFYGYLVGTPLRMWDYLGSWRPDLLLANSQETRRRITKYYRRDSLVLYPPVQDPQLKLTEKQKDTSNYYINVNRLSRPKHVEVLVEAANQLGITLYIVGGGKELDYLKGLAKPNIIFTGEISDIELSRLYLGAKGFLFASEDDEFGIAPVEAMLHGIPVIAYKSGGLKETVVHGKNGLLVDRLESALFVEAIKTLEKSNFQQYSSNAYKMAKKFTTAVFKEALLKIITARLGK
jgi:glycosyltransferase involved in cell wall biosynthesis